MIMDNENKKLSRNTKKRIRRRLQMNDDKKLILNKIKTEKKRKMKILDKTKQLEIVLVKINYAKTPKKLENALKELNEIHVVNANLNEIKNEILLNYEDDFEKVGTLKVGDQIRQTPIRFRNIADYEAYINAIVQDYESEDSVFNGYI